MMKKIQILFTAIIFLIFTVTGCSAAQKKETNMRAAEVITAQQAKEIMEKEEDFVILDVREQDEYRAGHIPGAILIPYTEIESRAEEELTDKDRLILVYCRSGRRSAIAAASLISMGYTNVKDFGGIIDWTYEVVVD